MTFKPKKLIQGSVSLIKPDRRLQIYIISFSHNLRIPPVETIGDILMGLMAVYGGTAEAPVLMKLKAYISLKLNTGKLHEICCLGYHPSISSLGQSSLVNFLFKGNKQ